MITKKDIADTIIGIPDAIIGFVRSDMFAIIALVFALIAQFTHTRFVYSASTGNEPEWVATCFALAFDISAFYFVMHITKWSNVVSYCFAFAVIWIDIYYGYLNGINIVLTATISTILGGTIVAFSHAIRSNHVQKNKADNTGLLICPHCHTTWDKKKSFWTHIQKHKKDGVWTEELTEKAYEAIELRKAKQVIYLRKAS